VHVHITLSLPCGEQKRQNAPSVKEYATTLAILALLSATLALADDFKTINGKEYKKATISRVEDDGIVLRTNSGISKVYFAELPKEVQERFHYVPVAEQRQREEVARRRVEIFIGVIALIVGLIIAVVFFIKKSFGS
jgi:hypothetical protein